MKKRKLISLFLTCITVLLASCGSVGAPSALQNGDLIFVATVPDEGSEMEEAISASTGRDSLNYVHVAIVERENKNIWIIDATPQRGVDRYPLKEFLEENLTPHGCLPPMRVMRLKDTSGVATFVSNAKSHLGSKYDFAFLPGNKELYCSELILNSYVTVTGDTLFHQKPMNFKSEDGSFPHYWVELFKELGEPIPQGLLGTNPQDMLKENILTHVEVDINQEIQSKRIGRDQ